MKAIERYILTAAVAAAAFLPATGASGQTSERVTAAGPVAETSMQSVPEQPLGPDSATVYTIEQCYTLVQENYPLVKRYELLDLTEEYTLKNAYMNYFPQISLQGSASWQTDVLEFCWSSHLT